MEPLIISLIAQSPTRLCKIEYAICLSQASPRWICLLQIHTLTHARTQLLVSGAAALVLARAPFYFPSCINLKAHLDGSTFSERRMQTRRRRRRWLLVWGLCLPDVPVAALVFSLIEGRHCHCRAKNENVKKKESNRQTTELKCCVQPEPELLLL